MSNVWFIGDTHFGHKNIQKLRLHVKSEEDNNNQIKSFWKNNVTKRDVVWVLGDAAFTYEGLSWFEDLPGRKLLVRGNHDILPTREYLKVFEEVYGIVRYKDFWLTHCPIHPDELRGRRNIHGHVHYATIKQYESKEYDRLYINCSVEGNLINVEQPMIDLDTLKKLCREWDINEKIDP